MASGTGIGEFFVSLTVDAASGALTVGNLVSQFGALEIATVAEIGVLWELGVQLANVVDQGMKMSLGFEQFTMHTGLSAQALQKWQIVAQQSHASAQDVTSSLENITKGLALIGIGQDTPLLKTLQLLSISARDAHGDLKNADQIMTEIRHRLGVATPNVSTQELALSWAGINANLRETMLLSDHAFNKRGGLVPGMSAGQERNLDHLRETLVEIELKARQIGIDIGSSISPELEAWAKWTTKIVEDMISIVTWVLKLQPVKNALTIGGASLNTVGDLLDVVAGKKLDVNDIYRQSERMGGAFADLHREFGWLVPPAPGLFAGGGASKTVSIDNHPTYHIHEAHNPAKIREVIDKDFSELVSKHIVDPSDQQRGSAGEGF